LAWRFISICCRYEAEVGIFKFIAVRYRVHYGQEVKRGSRNAHEELHRLCPSPYSILLIRSRRLRWVGHIVRVRDEKRIQFWLENPKGIDHLGDLIVDAMLKVI
jgi:hypothetical protein